MIKKKYCGKILIRIPKSLHAALAAEAKSEGVSMNQLILVKLGCTVRIVKIRSES